MRNIMTMERGLHDLFNSLEIWFEATVCCVVWICKVDGWVMLANCKYGYAKRYWFKNVGGPPGGPHEVGTIKYIHRVLMNKYVKWFWFKDASGPPEETKEVGHIKCTEYQWIGKDVRRYLSKDASDLRVPPQTARDQWPCHNGPWCLEGGWDSGR